MKVTDYIAQAQSKGKTVISLEVLPPAKGKSIDSIYNTLDMFREFEPAFVNVTYHRAEQVFKKTANGQFQRIEIRKRPGTVGICAAIMNKYNVEAVPHLICGGFSKEETENALIDLHYLGIKNVLALRGDAASNEKYFIPNANGNANSLDLIKQIVNLNNGKYIEDDILDGGKTDFCIGAACYPEKHFESPNIETDLQFLRQKIDAGASYLTTQMFFNNAHLYKFQENCRKSGINVPIIPGLKPITSKKQLTTIPSAFNVEVPFEISDALNKAKNAEEAEKAGEEWLLAQCKDLISKGEPILHFFTLGKPHVVANALKKLL